MIQPTNNPAKRLIELYKAFEESGMSLTAFCKANKVWKAERDGIRAMGLGYRLGFQEALAKKSKPNPGPVCSWNSATQEERLDLLKNLINSCFGQQSYLNEINSFLNDITDIPLKEKVQECRIIKNL